MKTVTFEVPDDSYRTTEKDFTYTNGDLNKFIHDELPPIMTAIDVDLLQHKIRRSILRIVENKHEGERVGDLQLVALKEIADIFAFAMKKGYKMNGVIAKLECHIIIGNYPFEKLDIHDLTKGIAFQIEGNKKGQEVWNYLTMEEDVKVSESIKHIYF
jgi:hypothetical protein